MYSPPPLSCSGHRGSRQDQRITSCAPITALDPGCIFFPHGEPPSVTFTRTRLMRLHTHQCMRTGRRICAVDTLARITEKTLDDMEELNNKKRRIHPDHQNQVSSSFYQRLFTAPRAGSSALPPPQALHILPSKRPCSPQQNAGSGSPGSEPFAGLWPIATAIFGVISPIRESAITIPIGPR